MEIRIAKSARQCCLSGRLFEHGEKVVSTVRMVDHAYSREDYAPEAWDKAQADNTIAVWTSIFHDPEVERSAPAEVVSPLKQFFYEICQHEDRASLAQAYLAAELLRRQRAFRLVKGSDREDGEERISLYLDRQASKLIEVRDPSLTYAELDAARKTLLEQIGLLENTQESKEDTGHEHGTETENRETGRR